MGKNVILLLETSQTRMKKFSAIATITLGAALALGSCNSSDVETGEASTYGVAVHSFKLGANDKVLANLDSVFFSIDLVNAQIFNADSLPFGTPTNKLVPSITMYDNVSVAELSFSTEKGDTVVNYLKNTTDTIDFSRGPVGLRVVSWDGLVERRYTIKVNVHQLKTDSLVWNKAARRTLPSSLSAPTEQKTSADNQAIYCLTRAGSQYSLQSSPNPFYDDWTPLQVSMPANTIVNSFTVVDGVLHVLANDNDSAPDHAHYTSDNGGQTWTPSGHRFTEIYGACAGKLLANVHNADNTWSLIIGADAAPVALPEGMPVSGFSNMILYSAPLAGADHAVIAGGNGADGRPVKAVWGYDGAGHWARLNANPMSEAVSDMMLASFETFRISSSWQAKAYPTLFLFGGRKADGTLNRTMYTSMDYGITWQQASELLQLPEEVPSVYGAQTFRYSGMLHEQRAQSLWQEIPLRHRLPMTATIEEQLPQSRAIAPITEWECSYIFMFGGRRDDGNLSPFIWRATLNRLTFKPIQ